MVVVVTGGGGGGDGGMGNVHKVTGGVPLLDLMLDVPIGASSLAYEGFRLRCRCCYFLKRVFLGRFLSPNTTPHTTETNKNTMMQKASK